MESRKSQVGRYVGWRIAALESRRGDSSGRAELAQLRHGVGRVPGEAPQLWGMFLKNLPEEMESKDGRATREEWAIYVALTLYALHQQGHAESVHCEGTNLGEAAAQMVPKPEDEKRAWDKLNLVAMAADMQEMQYRLRQLIQLFKSKGICLDYAQLAKDLYEFQFADGVNRVRLRWGQSFFQSMSKNSEGQEEMNDEGK